MPPEKKPPKEPEEKLPIVDQEFVDENGNLQSLRVRIVEGGADKSHTIREKFRK